MLEALHLTKVYKTKGGAETKALDDVSVRFPEKGLVFLLGKSGSGKSTLLNVCGGLDAPTSGEIIVKGRSSKNFSQSDFDSYRNTFIGFVFQEYNILNEFTVEDNIALALELQGKPKDKKAIKALLDDVDLGAYAHRKPNTLSGGQKQRIAIARALIKQPQIIMADEPTGALDSATGKQVFETLKKLSQKKLVIVVSHDRDSAEEYADRIIELKDGKIISDVTKEAAASQSLGENLSIIGENTLSVKNGAALTEQDYRYIYAFLSNHRGAMITGGEKEIADFKKVSHITEDGGKEFFADTDEKKIQKKQYDPKKTHFIRSKLPLRHAFKIGVSGLKSKPVRLIFTVLLCSVAFIMFGLFSTLTFYDKNETLYQTINDSGISVLHVDKTYQYTRAGTYPDGDTYSYTSSSAAKMTDEEVKKIATTFGAETFGVIRTDKTIGGVNVSELGSYYYAGYSLDARRISYAAYLPEGHAFRSKVTVGRYPVNDDEICISSYTASAMLAAKYEEVTSAQQLTTKTLTFEYSSSSLPASFKIVGIFDSGDNNFPAEYEKYKTEKIKDSASKEEKSVIEKIAVSVTDGYHLIAFFNKNTTNALIAERNSSSGNDAFRENIDWAYQATVFENPLESQPSYFFMPYLSASLLPDVVKTAFLAGKTSVGTGEIVLTSNAFNQLIWQYQSYQSSVYNVLYSEFNENGYEEYTGYITPWLTGETPTDASQHAAYDFLLSLIGESGIYHQHALTYKSLYSLFNKQLTLFTADKSFNEWFYATSDGYYYIYDETESTDKKISLTEDEIQQIYTALLNAMGEKNLLSVTSKVYVQDYNEAIASSAKTFTLVGICRYQNDSLLFFNDADYAAFKTVAEDNGVHSYRNNETVTTKYKQPEGAVYDAVFFPYSSEHRNDLAMFSYDYDENDARIFIGNAEGQELDMVNYMVEEMSQVFMWIGIVLAAFSMLLLSSFIATSISYKKKEIGILRAVGARGADVFKIFFSEAFVIALICFVLGVAGSIFGCRLLNTELADTINASIFVFGGASIAILLGIALVTSAVATFFPVSSAARKKPVEAIRAL